MAVYFSYGTRHDQLVTMGRAAAPGKVPTTIKIQLDLNGTRVAAKHGLLHSELRLYKALQLYQITKQSDEIDWSFIDADWSAVAEFETVLNITKLTTTLAQYEQHYTGAYMSLIKAVTLNALRVDSILVVDLSQMDESRHP
eukprot:6176609-Pleurochrysis_carterae.AAC.3